MGVEGVGVQCVVQAHHLLLCARGVRLHDMGCSGVHDGGALVEKDDAVQTVGVAGAVDALDRFPFCSALTASRFISVDLPQPGPLLMRYICIPGSCRSGSK